MFKIISKISFILFSLFLILFALLAFIGSRDIWVLGLFALVVLGFITLLSLKDTKIENISYRVEEGTILIVASIIGAVLTSIISINFNLGAVIGSAFVGLAASLLFPFNGKNKNVALAVYCGSFVGMSTALIFPNLFLVGCAGALAGIIFYLIKHDYLGIGGKLGSIALVGVSLTVIFINLIHK